MDNTFINSEVQGNVSISKAINNTKYKLKDILLEIRKNLCLYCGNSLNSPKNYFFKLPCECRICSQKCFMEYTTMISQNIIVESQKMNSRYSKYVNMLQCFCGFLYHSLDFLLIIQELEKRNLKDQKKMYQNYIINIWTWRCMKCFCPFKVNGTFLRILFDTDKIDKKLLKSKNDLKHLLCDDCNGKYNIYNEEDEIYKKNIYCDICEFEHRITKIKKVDENNEEESDCSIF